MLTISHRHWLVIQVQQVSAQLDHSTSNRKTKQPISVTNNHPIWRSQPPLAFSSLFSPPLLPPLLSIMAGQTAWPSNFPMTGRADMPKPPLQPMADHMQSKSSSTTQILNKTARSLQQAPSSPSFTIIPSVASFRTNLGSKSHWTTRILGRSWIAVPGWMYTVVSWFVLKNRLAPVWYLHTAGVVDKRATC